MSLWTDPIADAGDSLDPQPGLRPVTPLSIAAAQLHDLAAAMDAAGLNPALRAQARAVERLVGGLDPYLGECTTAPSVALAEVARRTLAHQWSPPTSEAPAAAPAGLEAEMLSGHVEGQLLKMLVQVCGAQRVLEVGMFTGYSALAMAEGLPADGVVVACEIDSAVAAFAESGFSISDHGHKIDVRVGPATDTLRVLADAGEQFDLVFLDADKGGYAGYLAQVLDGSLLADGALVVVDNTVLQGEPYAGGTPGAAGAAIRDFNVMVAADPGLEQVVLPLRDGLTLIRRV